MKRHITANNSIEYQKIMENLRARISSGTFKPGQRLVETHLAEIFGTTRGKVREALRKLEQDGFVKIIPNVGAVVAEFSQKDIAHLYDLLGVLEGLAVRVITPFVTPEQIESIDILMKRVEEVTDNATLFFERNHALHALLMKLSENDDLIKLTNNQWLKIKCIHLQCLSSPGQMQAAVREHRNMFEAIRDGNAVKAEKLMRNHLLRAKDRLLKYLNKSF